MYNRSKIMAGGGGLKNKIGMAGSSGTGFIKTLNNSCNY